MQTYEVKRQVPTNFFDKYYKIIYVIREGVKELNNWEERGFSLGKTNKKKLLKLIEEKYIKEKKYMKKLTAKQLDKYLEKIYSISTTNRISSIKKYPNDNIII